MLRRKFDTVNNMLMVQTAYDEKRQMDIITTLNPLNFTPLRLRIS